MTTAAIPDHAVLLVTPGTSPEAIHAFVFEDGPLPDGARVMSFEEYEAQGRGADCDCKLIQCVCLEKRLHLEGCQQRLALTCAIPISCDAHGLDICSTCDPCTCPPLSGGGHRVELNVARRK